MRLEIKKVLRSEEETEHNEKENEPRNDKNNKWESENNNRRMREDFGIVSYCTIIES